MRHARTVVLDNEAVAALHDPGHRKHRRALAILEAATHRASRRAGPVRVVVPTAVRVEAAWGRRTAAAATINRLRVDDVALDRPTADHAARLRACLGVSVADAHLGATVDGTSGPHAIVTSDVSDMRRIITHLAASAVVVQI